MIEVGFEIRYLRIEVLFFSLLDYIVYLKDMSGGFLMCFGYKSF